MKLLISFISGLLLFAGCASTSKFPTEFKKDAVVFLAAASIPGGAEASVDKSGLSHSLLEDGQSYLDSFDGIGSAFAYTGYANRYLALCDRGPNKVQYKGGDAVDFTTSYANRFQIIDVTVAKTAAGWTVIPELKATSVLKDETGKGFVGFSTAFTEVDPNKNLRLDSEGIRVATDGSVWISDEYGPVIYHFDQYGKRLGTLKVPQNFLIKKLAPTLTEEMKSKDNTSGRYTNRGAEGLALTPDGKTLVVALQSSLIQDGGNNGLGTRFLVYDLTDTNKTPKQFVYVCDSTKTAISEILAVNNHQFLVDERDGKSGEKGVKLLYFIDLNQPQNPTEISAVDHLPLTGYSSSIIPLKKVLFADLGQILNNAKPFTSEAGLPDKIEGIAFGPDLPDGRHLLLATNDNDYAGTFPNYIFAFAVESNALPDFLAISLDTGIKFIP